MFKLYPIFIVLVLVNFSLVFFTRNLKHTAKWKWWLGIGLFAFVTMLFMSSVSIPENLFSDLLFSDFVKAYYPAGYYILRNPSEIYYQYQINTNGAELANQMPLGVGGFVNIPIIALLFTPFSYMSKPLAVALFTMAGILAVVLFFFVLVNFTRAVLWERILIIETVLINGPLYNSLKFGNTTHFILLLLVLVLFFLEKKRDIICGILLAIVTLIKPPIGFLVIYFIFRKRWRVIFGFAVTLVAVTGVSILLFGYQLHLFWLQNVFFRFSNQPLASFNVQSVSGLLARLLTNASLISWQPIVVQWEFKLIQYILVSLLVGGTIWICMRSKSSQTLEVQNLEFSIFLCLALIISPISWTHYYLLMLLPLTLYFGNKLAVPKRKIWLGFVMLSILLISLPEIALPERVIYSSNFWVRLLVSHYFFGGVLLLGILLVARWRLAKSYPVSS